MANTALTPVEFHGASLFVTIIDNAPFVSARQICEDLGLDWKAQHSRIKRHAVLSTCVVVTTMQMSGDDQAREVFMLPLDKLNGWLFGVSVGRVKPELRPRLIEYQAECFDVLASHFHVKPPVSEITMTESKPEPVTTAGVVNLLLGDCLSDKALMDIANAANRQIFQIASNNKNRGYGYEVAERIKGLSDADLHAITVAATMETWMRTIKPTLAAKA